MLKLTSKKNAENPAGWGIGI